MHNTLSQFIKFAIIGVVNTAIDFCIYFALTRYTGLFAVDTGMKYVANIISFSAGATFSYFANRTWSFKQEHRANIQEALKFYSTTLSSLVLNVALLALFVKIFALHDLVAKIFATLVTIIWNFVLTKFFVFRNTTSRLSV